VRVDIEPHEDEPPPRAAAHPLPAEGEPLRVLVIGAISRIKGYDVVHGLAQEARKRELPIKVSLLGYSMDDARLTEQGVSMLGRYFDNELLERISAADPHLVFVPSIWPETYCYVLSGALRSGRRIAVFDLGAQADRARRHDPHHLLLPLALADRPDELADALLAACGPTTQSLRAAA
jgi:O-antigen biosynthesis protein